MGEAHADCEFNASHIAEVLAQNLEELVVTTVFVDFINRENFWNSKQQHLGHLWVAICWHCLNFLGWVVRGR